jgi:predicted nucleic acid-binding Zn ribbon protein
MTQRSDKKPESSSPEPLGEILGRLFAARGWGRRQDRIRLERAWAEAAGKDRAESTRVVGMKRTTLEIEVKGAILLQELSQFHRRRLLTELRKLLPNVIITDLKFRAGNW